MSVKVKVHDGDIEKALRKLRKLTQKSENDLVKYPAGYFDSKPYYVKPFDKRRLKKRKKKNMSAIKEFEESLRAAGIKFESGNKINKSN